MEGTRENLLTYLLHHNTGTNLVHAIEALSTAIGFDLDEQARAEPDPTPTLSHSLAPTLSLYRSDSLISQLQTGPSPTFTPTL